ncbi:MAG: ribose-phosphate diphosphokinase, partial [Allosphingosinicella sp.]
VRLRSDVSGRDVVLLCSLDSPDEKILPLLFAAAAAREQGARRVGLVAPYLAYMRQDKAFKSGEAVTSSIFARTISTVFDWLVTVDPHLHRHPGLESIYSIPAIAVSAAGPIAEWIGREVPSPFLIGPDEESVQWVGLIAKLAAAPFTTLRKTRRGDRDVDISGTGIAIGDRTPVIVDDIISSAVTMAEAVRLIRRKGGPPPICIGVHALFADGAVPALQAAGPARIVTVDTIGHPTNAIGVAGVLAEALAQMLADPHPGSSMT